MKRKGGDFQSGDRITLRYGIRGFVVGCHGEGRSRKVYWHNYGLKMRPTRSNTVGDLRKMVALVTDREGRAVFVDRAAIDAGSKVLPKGL